jgi:hypothetical protein
MDVTGQGNRHINLETLDSEPFKILIRPIALFIFSLSRMLYPRCPVKVVGIALACCVHCTATSLWDGVL